MIADQAREKVGAEADHSASSAPPLTPTAKFVSAWLSFETMRRELEKNIHELELSNFNLNYGSKTEQDFKNRLKEARSLFDNIEALLSQ